LTLVALALGGVIAACGSASSSSGTTTSSTTASAAAGGAGGGANATRRAALTACLKQHGVTLPARPPGAGGGPPGSGAPGGGTGTGTTGTGTTPRRRGFFGGGGLANNPKLRAAFQACGAKFGFGGGARGFRGRLSRTAITKYVTCVRQHGYNLPTPNLSGKGPAFPSNIQSNSKFQTASRACQSLLVPPRGGGTSTTSGA
jgi:hypothetical protein